MMPKLHIFNPGHEAAVWVNNPHYMPPANVLTLTNDLALLPLWYGDSDDFVYGDCSQETAVFEHAQSFELAKPINKEELLLQNMQPLMLAPWGLSPAVIHSFSLLRDEGAKLILPEWKQEVRTYTHRRFATYMLTSLPICSAQRKPSFCQSIDEIKNYMRHNDPPHILKSPFSSSGRGIRMIRTIELEDQELPWIRGVLNKQGEISIEPLLDKKQDFAMEFYSDGNGLVHYQGLSIFSTEKDGSFNGNILADEHYLAKKYISPYATAEYLEEIKTQVTSWLSQTIATHYKGYLGVDMIVYQQPTGSYAIHPCIEINMRYTMGLVACQLSKKHIDPEAKGIFKVQFFKNKGEALNFYRSQRTKHPLQMGNRKITKGFQSLCPVTENTHYMAYVIID